MLARILVNLARSISTYIYKSVQQFEDHEQNIARIIFKIEHYYFLSENRYSDNTSIAYLALIEIMAYRL